jgi:eukaryotic-like serine/threonine-protein kinase
MTTLPSFATALPMSELNCTVLTGYAVHRTLARCDSSLVYVAERADRAGETFALKVYSSPLSAQTFGATATAQELCGPCVVPLVEYGLWQGKPAIVSAWVDGISLQTLLSAADQRLPLAVALRIAGLICRALAEAHGAEGGALVHGRIEPSHILLGHDGAVQLIGFGGCSSRASVSRLHPSYVAPELAAGEPADVLCDLYSLGAVLYELTTGERPVGTHPQSAASLSPVVDERLDAMIMACLDPDPTERPFSIQAVERCLDACFEELELVPDPTELARLVGATR